MLEQYTYCPILYARRAELNAVARLPPVSRERIFPIIAARPWPNAKSMGLAWKRLQESLGAMRFGLDLDRSRLGRSGIQPASQEFDKLFSPELGYCEYFNAVKALDFAIPVLRVSPQGVEDAERQIARAEELDRGLILRLVYGEVHNAMAVLRDMLPMMTDPIVVIDAEWSRDLLAREVWATTLVQETLSLSEHAEIVLTGSSFPDSFTEVGTKKSFMIEERGLFSNVQRKINEKLFYGDWASTRPPRDGGGIGPRRIDLPQSNNWVIFREVGEESYKALANRVKSSTEWPRELNIWGTYTISSTADGLPGAIRGQEAAASARINIHMHRQALFGMLGERGDSEEPFVDL